MIELQWNSSRHTVLLYLDVINPHGVHVQGLQQLDCMCVCVSFTVSILAATLFFYESNMQDGRLLYCGMLKAS